MMSEHHELAVVLNECLQEFSDSINFCFAGHSVCHTEGVIILILITSLFGEIVSEIRAVVGNQ